MDSEALCGFCNTLNFGAAGFFGSDVNYDDVQLICKKITLDRVLQNSEQCFFCGKIAEFFNEWRLRKYPKQALDLGNAHAYVSSRYLKSLEVDKQGMPKGRLSYIDVLLTIEKPPPSEGFFRRSLRFRKCSERPLTVTNICNRESLLDWGDGQEHQAYCGRIRPLVADTRLFHKWKECCCAIHDGYCNSISGSRPRRLRLIDVKKRCVVDDEDGSRYVALSYVWGEWKLKKHLKKMPKLTKFTKDDFQKPESLTREKVLATIDDAIEVTRSLGLEYLWVDSLCILQEDDEDNNPQDLAAVNADQLEFIPQMDLIYGFASVTIVAASGDNADAGLPGIKQGSRTRKQIPFTIKGVSLLATLEPEGSGEYVEETDSHLRCLSYIGECAWNTRGWTFQEKLFSGRVLIFTPEQVYWECQKASWCEDGLWETTKSPTIYRHSLAAEEFRHPWGKDVDSFEGIYRKLVEVYSARNLTFLRDGLNAFEGILKHFERQDDQRFHWALPASFLSTALTWTCIPSATRRICKEKLEDGTDTQCLFPSWSWVGWVGQVLYAKWPGYHNVEADGLIFYYLDDRGLPTVVQPATATQTRSRTFIWMDDSITTVTREDIPESVFSLSIAPIILCFWSSAAILLVRVRHEVLPDDDDQPSLSHNGKPLVTCLWQHLPLTNRLHQEFGEFVVIGTDSFTSWDRNRISLLFVSWENGVAIRRGLVTINISEWVKLDKRVWKMITLR